MALLASLTPFSLIKAGCQGVTGHTDRAAETCTRWAFENPLTAVVIGVKAKIQGDDELLRKVISTQLENANSTANSIPVVGHVKGLIHTAFGDHEGAMDAYSAATRTTCVVGGGIAGGLAGGPLGAVAGGVGAGGAYDLGHTAVSHESQGMVGAIRQVMKDPTDGGNYFDLVMIPIGDGLMGYTAFKIVAKATNQSRRQPSKKRTSKGSKSGRQFKSNNKQASGYMQRRIDKFKRNSKVAPRSDLQASKSAQKVTKNTRPKMKVKIPRSARSKGSKSIKKTKKQHKVVNKLGGIGDEIIDYMGGPRKIIEFVWNHKDQFIDAAKLCNSWTIQRVGSSS